MGNNKHVIAIVGYGGMGSYHAKLLNILDRVKIASILILRTNGSG